jgi:hypothetical protein
MKSKKKARHTLVGVYPAVRKYSYLRRYGSLRRSRRATPVPNGER